MSDTWRPTDFDSVLELVKERAGLVIASAGRRAAENSIRRVAAHSGSPAPQGFLELLRRGEGAAQTLLAELTVGETYFFREPGQLDFIRREVLPTLGPGPRRVWSAGCATGEEAYTLAILLSEAGISGRVLGTDISLERLARARRGVYGRWSLRGVGDDLIGRWFRRTDSGLKVRSDLRQAVEFRPLNLAADDFPSATSGIWGMDVILCRNVLIYFSREVIARVAERLIASLAPDGWLFLGASDPPLAELVPCRAVLTDAGLAYRRAQPSASDGTTPGVRRHLAAPSASLTPQYALPSAPLEVQPTVPKVPKSVAPPQADPGPSEHAVFARVRTLADLGDLDGAGRACTEALERFGASADITYLQSMLLLQAGQPEAAAAAARRALYLDRGLAVAHLALGMSLAQMGQVSAARRAFDTAERLLSTLGPDDPVPGANGESAAVLRGMIAARSRNLAELAG